MAAIAALGHNLRNNVKLLKDQYVGEVIVFTGDSPLSARSGQGEDLICSGYMGSYAAVFLSAQGNNIEVRSPACIASGLVNIVATRAIKIGLEGNEEHPHPVRLYAKNQLTLAAREVSFGEVNILQEPQIGIIVCSKLKLHKWGEEDPPYFEMAKSWTSEDTELELINEA